MSRDQRFQSLVRLTAAAEGAFWVIALVLYTFRSGSLQFLHPEMFSLFILIPGILVFFIYRWRWKEKLYKTYRGMGNTRMIWVTFHPVRYFLTYFSLRTTVFFLILAMAQPVMGSQKVKGSKRVLDLVICMDISSSMNTMDIAPNTSRLEVAKRAVTQVLNNLRGERIAIVVFANEAYTQLPLTMDYGAAKMFINDIQTTMISNQGTNIGSALEVAARQFVDGESGHAIVVITDGEDHEQQWLEQTKKINDSDIELCYYGIGTERGGQIPNDPFDPSAGYKKDGGSTVVSRLNPNGLRKMAAATNSVVEYSGESFPDMSNLIANLTSVKNKEVRNVEFSIALNYYRIPLILALLCFLSYLFIPVISKRMQ